MLESRWARAAALGLLVLFALHLKVRLSVQNPRYDPADETGYFRAESAFQYRYARRLAGGRGIPALDYDAQHPEGVRTSRELTSWLERAAAWSWRMTPGRPSDFRWWILLFVGFCASLSIPALWCAARRLGAPEPLALAAAAAYGLSWAAQANTVAAFRVETIAWPLFFGTCAAIGAALERGQARPRRALALAGVFAFATMASWHFGRFAVLTLAAALGAVWLRRRRTEDGARLLRSLAALAAAGAATVVLVPSARESLLVASPEAYGHVYGLLWAKLRHGLVKPADPSLLSAVQRIEWTGPSASPEPGFLVFALLPLALVALPRLWPGPRREPEPAAAFGGLCDALTALFGLGTVLVSRLLPAFAFFLVLSALRLAAARRAAALCAGLFAAVALGETVKSLAPSARWNPVIALASALTADSPRPTLSYLNERELLRWLAAEARGRPVLAQIGLSASILAYSEAPVLLQPKFESKGVRGKTAQFVAALYGPETEFLEFCRRYEAGMFVYSIDHLLDATPEGARYAAARPLKAGSAAALMHFHPESLKNFRLLFQNEDFRVFAVGQPPRPGFEPLPIYDEKNYRITISTDGALSFDAAEIVRRLEQARLKLFLARLLASSGRPEEALAVYDDSFARWPPDAALRKEREDLRAALLRR